MNLFLSTILALFTSAESADILPIGAFQTNEECSAVLKQLYFDGMCVDALDGEPVSRAPKTSLIPRKRPEGL